MILYLLKVLACCAAFYGLYVSIFRKEKMLVFNRLYLLSSLIVALFIPLITITVQVPADQVLSDKSLPLAEPAIAESPAGFFPLYGWYATVVISVAVSFCLLVRFCINLYKFQLKMDSASVVYYKQIKMILLPFKAAPHSFMNTVFLNKDEFEAGQIENEVLEHEIAHVQQKHSWDILFIELLQIFFWFNPFLYLYKQAIKTNHELLADASVIKVFGNVRSYQNILLQRAGAQPALAFASSFNFLTTKKRLMMLHKTTNPVRAGLKAALTLPLLALLILVFSERIYARSLPSSLKPTSAKDSASKKEMQEYIDIMKKNEQIIDGKKRYKRSEEDEARQRVLLNKMNERQRKSLTTPPPPPEVKELKIAPPPPPAENGEIAVPAPPPPPKLKLKKGTVATPNSKKDKEAVKEIIIIKDSDAKTLQHDVEQIRVSIRKDLAEAKKVQAVEIANLKDKIAKFSSDQEKMVKEQMKHVKEIRLAIAKEMKTVKDLSKIINLEIDTEVSPAP